MKFDDKYNQYNWIRCKQRFLGTCRHRQGRSLPTLCKTGSKVRRTCSAATDPWLTRCHSSSFGLSGVTSKNIRSNDALDLCRLSQFHNFAPLKLARDGPYQWLNRGWGMRRKGGGITLRQKALSEEYWVLTLINPFTGSLNVSSGYAFL